jgi:hypothetical protein
MFSSNLIFIESAARRGTADLLAPKQRQRQWRLNVFLLQQRKECEDCSDGIAGRKAGQNRSPRNPRAAEYQLSTAFPGVRNDPILSMGSQDRVAVYGRSRFDYSRYHRNCPDSASFLYLA